MFIVGAGDDSHSVRSEMYFWPAVNMELLTEFGATIRQTINMEPLTGFTTQMSRL